MKRITLTRRSREKLLHIEAPGCIVNIQVGLTDNKGRKITSISISADGDRYSGDPEWWIEGEKGNASQSLRIIQFSEKEI